MDVLYIKGITSPNSDLELKYSLRSLSHVKDLGKVYICGQMPHFVTNVKFIPCDDIGYPAINHWWKVSNGIKNSKIGDNFILMYDDIFLLKDICLETYPQYHRGELDEFKTGTPLYRESLRKAKKWLLERGYPTKDYGLHIPFTYNRENFLKLDPIYENIKDDKSAPAPRSIYGNMFVTDSPQRDDFKMRRKSDIIPDVECFSCSDDAFPFQYLDNLFPNKGDFEK